MLIIAALILKSAVFRTESRGGHYRSDYPQSYADWQVHTLISFSDSAALADACQKSASVSSTD